MVYACVFLGARLRLKFLKQRVIHELRILQPERLCVSGERIKSDQISNLRGNFEENVYLLAIFLVTIDGVNVNSTILIISTDKIVSGVFTLKQR